MSGFSLGALTIEATSNPVTPIIQLIWRGRSTERKPGDSLGPYLTSAVGDAAAQRAALELRFEELEYFNSATVMSIIQCLQAARSKQVRVRVVYDDAVEWQRLSFDPLRVFASEDLLEIYALGAAAGKGAQEEGSHS